VTAPAPRLELHRLTFLDDGDEVVVGRRDTDSYAVLPADGAALVRVLDCGGCPARAASWYRATYGEAVDIDAFVATLREFGFVRERGDVADAGAPVRGQRLGRALFSAPAWVLYALLVLAAIIACISDPALVPGTGHVHFTGSLLISGIALTVGQWLLALVHEAFHVLAGRRLGLRTSVRISRRFWYVVYETRLEGLVSVPRRRRYLVILAGMLADALVVAGLVLVAAGTGGVLHGLCLALAFTTLPRIAWQFLFHLRTDIYYLATTVLGLDDLDAAARSRLRELTGRKPAPGAPELGERDRRAARWYAPLLVVGYALSSAMLVLVVLPLASAFLGPALRALSGADGGSQAPGSAVLLAITLFELSLAVAVALRERRAHPHSAGRLA
jgi:hypothetical protein